MPALLLDTNVIQHASGHKGTPEKKQAFVSTFAVLFEEYTPAVPSIVKYELFAGATVDTVTKIREFTDNIKIYETDGNVISLAAALATIYKNHDATKAHHQGISIPDKLIAATCLLTQACYILTCDFNDFPRPFFEEHKAVHITFKGKERQERMVEAYILKPNAAAYRNAFKQFFPANEAEIHYTSG